MRTIIMASTVSFLLIMFSFGGLTVYLSQYFTLKEFIIFLGEIICDDSKFQEFIKFYIVIVIPFAIIALCNNVAIWICNLTNRNND